MSSFPMPIERLLPQRRPMLLLDRLLSCTASEGTADTLISPGNLFRLPDDTIHAAALFELMAQTYAAVHGYQNQLAGKPVSIGYLAGITRAVVRGAARVGDRLTVGVRQTALFQPFVRAEARVVRDGETLAEGELTLFVPPAVEEPS
jgi:predicted hotdog family 3-hydroxylacyl-ACP dehydratase